MSSGPVACIKQEKCWLQVINLSKNLTIKEINGIQQVGEPWASVQHPSSPHHTRGSRALPPRAFSISIKIPGCCLISSRWATRVSYLPPFGLFYLLFQSKRFLPLLPSSILYHIPHSFRHNILLDPAWHVSTCPVVSIPLTNSYSSSKIIPRGMWYPVVHHPSYIKCPSDITGTNSPSLNPSSCPGELDLATPLHFGYVFFGKNPF